MTGIFLNKTKREDFLVHTWKVDKVRTMEGLIAKVKEAEKSGILVVKRENNKPDAAYEKNLRWYMSKLEREGKIKGFCGPVGRPRKRPSSMKKLK